MMSERWSRRDVLSLALPAAAFLGSGLIAAPSAQAQQATTATQGAAGSAAAGAPAGASIIDAIAASYQNGQYVLPKLPYAYEALEPHLDAETMRLHHDKHHQAYVDNLNKAAKALAAIGAAAEIDPARLSGLQRDLSFNGGGHVLHSIFWLTMAPQAGGEPQGALAQALTRQYGSFDGFKNYYSKVAAGVKGSGWALLAYEPLADTLAVFEVNEHDTKMIAGTTPLLPLDVWEHAYYLKYQNKRADYIKAWWNVVNWSAVGQAYDWVRARYH